MVREGMERAGGLTASELLRYSRQMVIPEVGEAGQRKLQAASVLVVGVGGLGSPQALYLAAAGVGRLGLVDHDVVEQSNLQRQIMYGTADVGRRKLEAAVARLADVNPSVELVPHEERLTSANALEIIRSYDIVVDGTDNFPTRYLVNDACVLTGKPNVYGSVFRFEGQVSVFGAPGGPCYRCLFREPPAPGMVPSCAEAGVLGVLPGIIGTLQGLETIKLVLGVGRPLIGRLLLFDGLELNWREVALRRDPRCPACGDSPTLSGLSDYEAFCGLAPEPAASGGAAGPERAELTALELKERLAAGELLELVDVREPAEWAAANLAAYGARLIPLRELRSRLGELDPGAEIVVHCHTGPRAARAVRTLKEAGYPRVLNLKGGILAWAEQVEPTLARRLLTATHR